jgi:hypothetical protein
MPAPSECPSDCSRFSPSMNRPAISLSLVNADVTRRFGGSARVDSVGGCQRGRAPGAAPWPRQPLFPGGGGGGPRARFPGHGSHCSPAAGAGGPGCGSLATAPTVPWRRWAAAGAGGPGCGSLATAPTVPWRRWAAAGGAPGAAPRPRQPLFPGGDGGGPRVRLPGHGSHCSPAAIGGGAPAGAAGKSSAAHVSLPRASTFQISSTASPRTP